VPRAAPRLAGGPQAYLRLHYGSRGSRGRDGNYSPSELASCTVASRGRHRSFRCDPRGYVVDMIDTKSIPRPGDRWLSRPPYLLIAHVVSLDDRVEPPVVSYELQDDDGFPLESVEHAVLDGGWWRTFQPLVPNRG
jgi:hypothetical protein